MKTIQFSIAFLALYLTGSFAKAGNLSYLTSPEKNYAETINSAHKPDYKLLESGSIAIFQRQRPGDKLNGFKPVYSYYFSLEGSTDLHPLTLDNLKYIYRSGPEFEIIDGYFRSDADLISYDNIHKQFRINYYLSKNTGALSESRVESIMPSPVNQNVIKNLKKIEDGPLVIYERRRPGNKLDIFKPVLSYYFSLKDSSQVYNLNLRNLKSLFYKGQAFELIDTRFENDADLLVYDDIHKQYRINYYLSKLNDDTSAINNDHISAPQGNNQKTSDLNIVDTGLVTIYRSQKATDKLNQFKPAFTFFFRKKNADAIYELNLNNIKTVFNDDASFAMLDSYFKKDADLVAYDAIHQQYKLNYYLAKTVFQPTN